MSTINKSLLSLSEFKLTFEKVKKLHSNSTSTFATNNRATLNSNGAICNQRKLWPTSQEESRGQNPHKNAISKNNPFYVFPCAPLAVNIVEKETKTCRPKNEIHIKQIWIFLWPRNFWLMIRATITEKPGKKLWFQAENKNEMLRYW